MSRANRRRLEKAAPAIKPDAPLIDFVIWTGDGHDPTACIASLPTEGVTVATCGLPDGSPYAARNKAAAKGRAPFLAFVDADCTLEDAASLPLALAHLQNGASVVGGLLLTGDRVFAAGYAFNVEARPFFRFAQWRPTAAKVQERRTDIQAVPLAFMLTRRNVFRVARFREEYQSMAYGDADYCLRANKYRGMTNGEVTRVVYEPAVRVQTNGALLLRPHDMGVMLLRTNQPVYDELRLL